ncbi:MAG TPA: AAA family ATPase [Gemmatimonadaceae bacterium]
MPLTGLRVAGFRAFEDTEFITTGPMTAIVGRNDCGKSSLLHALRLFFEPPKRGGVTVADIHCRKPDGTVAIEVVFDPMQLSSTSLKIDAKHSIDLVEDRLVAADGRLHLRLSCTAKETAPLEILVADVDADDLFPLALKKHDELLMLLEKRKLPAVKAGVETNQQKRANLREAAYNAGLGTREAWVDGSAIEKQLRGLLPQFIYFADTARYGIDETSVQNQFKGIVDKVLGEHADAQKVESEMRATVQKEFDKVFARLERLTDTVSAMKAEPSVNWKKAVDGIALNWTDAYGIETPFELRGAGVRRLFMVAYFQYQAAETLHSENGPRYVYAIEEPEVHLHPGAQRLLAQALRELGELGHTVVYTTHSPAFASATPVRDLILVERAGTSARALPHGKFDKQHLARELGVEASDRLVGKNHVVLVEGPRDVEFYSFILGELNKAGYTSLSPADVLFLQCGGTDNLEFNTTTRCIDDAGLKWAVLMDSDRPGPGAPDGQGAMNVRNSLPASCAAFRVLERSFIENYLDPVEIKAVTGVECINPLYGKATLPTGTPLPNASWKRIKAAGPKIARMMGIEKLRATCMQPSGNCEWTDHFEAIRTGFKV